MTPKSARERDQLVSTDGVGGSLPRPSGREVQLPFKVDKYICEKYLGGNMADLYLARDTKAQRQVVLKLLKEEDCWNDESRQRFIREGQLACRCSHPNIIVTFECDEYETRPYIVMEFLQGKSLGDLILNGPLTDRAAVLRIALQTASALRYLHSPSIGIIHRDLKPDNIYIDNGLNAKLIDFGIAHAGDFSITKPGQLIGSPLYMSPEQVNGRNIDSRTDVYSFGVLLFKILTGKSPYAAQTINELWGAIPNAPPNIDLLRELQLPRALIDVVAKCLEKSPDQRYSEFGEICTVLEEISQSQTGAVKTGKISSGLSRRKLALMILAATAGVGGIAYGVLGRTRLPERLELPSGNMVLVEGGDVLLGPNKQRVRVDTFYMDETEVSNGAYALFCEQTKRPKPPGFSAAQAEYPVVNVAYEDAEAFAAWAGKRLPVANEWETAARSSDARLFPWGNEHRFDLANVIPSNGGPQALAPVYSFRKGASPYGVLNLCGNVWEWVNTSGGPTQEVFDGLRSERELRDLVPPLSIDEIYFQIRGGAFDSDSQNFDKFISDSGIFPARGRGPNLGFRCAKTPDR